MRISTRIALFIIVQSDTFIKNKFIIVAKQSDSIFDYKSWNRNVGKSSLNYIGKMRLESLWHPSLWRQNLFSRFQRTLREK